MAEIDAKVNMSLDDIIKMEKKKKASNPKAKRGGTTRGGTRGAMRGQARGSMRGSMRGSIKGNNRGNTRGNMRGNMRNNNMRGRNQTFNKRGQFKRYPQNNQRGGFFNKQFSNGTVKTNLRRSRSNLSLNRFNQTSPRSNRGGFASRRGGRFGGLTRSRSRTNLSFNNKSNFVPKKGFLQRTSSMPNLRDPTSVYNRLGYQSPGQVAYRNRVKRAKNVLLQRHSKAMRMQRALSLSPTKSPLISRYNSGLHSDQLMRAQRRAQYEEKLMRMGNARSNIASSMSSYMNNFNNPYEQAHPALNLYDSELESDSPLVPQRQMQRGQLQRGRSPFRQSLQNFKAVMERARSASASRQKRGRSRSQSRTRGPSRRNSVARSTRNSIISLTDGNDIEDRSFSEVMYSLSNNFGVTGRTLNDRFSLF